MLPLRDRNPTYHVPLVTIVLVLVNIAVFALIQPREGVDQVRLPDGSAARLSADVRFTFEHAAIPCEITEQRPLDAAEIAAFLGRGEQTCRDTPGDPLFPGKSVWLAAITSMFLHADWFHLGSNMLFLWIFGNNIEDHVGVIRYGLFYLLAGLVAMITHIALQPDSAVPVVGASGAVAGVMGAYLVWFPRAPVTTVVLLFLRDIPAGMLLSVWFVLQFFTGQESGIAWGAHVGGFAFGAVAGTLVRFVPGLCRTVWREPWRSGVPRRWGTRALR